MPSLGSHIAGTAAQVAGIAVTSNPLGASMAATIGTFFVPGLAAGASKAAIAGAVFTGSWLFAWAAIPVIGTLLFLSFVTPPEASAKYRLLALVLGFANVITCAGIAAAALSASGVAVSFAATATCLLVGTGVAMLAAAILAGGLATCFFSAIGDVLSNGQGGSYVRAAWG